MLILLSNSELKFEIDDEDFEKVSQYKWFLQFDREHKPTCVCAINGKNPFSIGRFLLGCIKDNGLDAEHKDRNILNNKKSNLRWATFLQNAANKAYKTNTSGYKGVIWDKARSKWSSRIQINYKMIHLGRFKNLIEAAIAYDDAAILYHGEFAVLNFPLYGA